MVKEVIWRFGAVVVSFILGLFLFLFFILFLDRRFNGGALLGILSGFLFFISLEGVFLFFCALATVLRRVPGRKAFVHVSFRSQILGGGVFIPFLTIDLYFYILYIVFPLDS